VVVGVGGGGGGGWGGWGGECGEGLSIQPENAAINSFHICNSLFFPSILLHQIVDK
jgi:hypothetical protein